MDTPKLYTLAEAAEKLGVSRATIYRRIHAGLIPTVTAPALPRYPAKRITAAALEKFRQERTNAA